MARLVEHRGPLRAYRPGVDPSAVGHALRRFGLHAAETKRLSATTSPIEKALAGQPLASGGVKGCNFNELGCSPWAPAYRSKGRPAHAGSVSVAA